MAATKVYLLNKSLYEISETDEIIKSDIQKPPGAALGISRYSGNITAFQTIDKSVSIYELIGREFVLIRTLEKFENWPYLKGHTSIIELYGNFLSVKLEPHKHIYVIYDLDNPKCRYEEFLSCHATFPVYCDGIISYAPVFPEMSSRYYNIHISSKIVTHDCPHFMKFSEKLKLENKYVYLNSSSTIIVGNTHYDIITGQLLYTGPYNFSRDYFNAQVSIMHNKMEIAPGAPIKEYKYGGLYIYVKQASTGKLTKAATRIEAPADD